MSQESRNSRIAVLLFTDIGGSVKMKHRLGTEGYARLLAQHHHLLSRALETVQEGKVRKFIGDSVLCEFTTAADAVNTALLFQTLLRKSKWETTAPEVRIGLHQGQIIESNGELVGLPVDIASRVMGLAQTGQILMTRPVHDDARQFVREHPIAIPEIESPPTIQWKAHGDYYFKGNDKPMEVFEVGAVGFAPLTAPPDTEKAHSANIAPASSTTAKMVRSPVVGAAIAVGCGLVMWSTTLGDAWMHASYDNLFRFGSRSVTNQVVIVLMDNDAFAELGQARDQPWDRTLHAKLLNKLADDHCPLVVMDVFFQRTNNAQIDQMLAAAMARMPNIVLDADQASLSHPGLASVRPTLPLGMFLAAARMNWGVGWLNPDPDLIVRRHWPLFSPGPYPSLPWMAAKISGARLDNTPTERWVRYYDLDKTWVNLSYHFALAEGPGYFRDKIVFIGTQPRTSLPDNERDEFCTPQFHWTDETVGGVKVLATEYLNLMNHDWLSRMAWPVEMLLLTLTGTLLGAGLTHFRRLMTIILALGGALAITVTAVLLSQFTNYWFPWLIVVGGQLPCALAWVMIPQKAQAPPVAAPVEPVEPGEETSGRKRAR